MPRKKDKKIEKETITNTVFNFEKSLEQLTQLALRMERGNLPLEESLQCYETGIKLIRECQQALVKAEQKVQILSKQEGVDVLKPYQSDNGHDD